MRRRIGAGIIGLWLALSPFNLVPTALATVTSTTNKVTFTGDGSTTAFAFSFKIFAGTDLLVQTVVGGTTTTKTITTDYTVALTTTAPSAGTVTMIVAPSSTTTLVITRNLPLTQQTHFSENQATPAKTYENAYDRAVMLVQRLQEQIDRAILNVPSSSATIVLPAPVDGKLLGWVGTTLSNVTNAGPQGPAGPAGTGDVVGPVTNTDANVPQWNGANSKTLKDGLAVGTAANNLVQLTGAAKLPAVDGSLLTNLPSMTGVKVFTFTRDQQAASGTVNYTGAAFTPSFAAFSCSFATTNVGSLIGFDDGTTAASQYRQNGGTVLQFDSSNSIHFETTVGNSQTGKVTAWLSNGATVTWTKTGAPTAGVDDCIGVFLK